MSREIDALVCPVCDGSVPKSNVKYCSRFQRYDGVNFYLNVHGYWHNPNVGKMHRYVWEVEKGDIPDGHDIHHIDGDKANNHISNLDCISHSEHSIIHNKERSRLHYENMAKARWDKCRGK